MPLNGDVKVLLMRVVETIIIGVIVTGVSVYAQSVRQDAVNQFTDKRIAELKLDVVAIHNEITVLTNTLIGNELAQSKRNAVFYGKKDRK